MIASSTFAGAQVVEDKNPATPPVKIDANDTIKAKSPVDKPSPSNPAGATELNASQKAANSTGSTVADTANQGAAAAKQNAAAAAQNAASQTQNTVNRSADAVKNAADRAGNATQNAADRAGNAANRAANQADRAADRATDAANNAANRTQNAADRATNASANTGVAANANVGAGQIATQLGLNFAANAANALTLSTVAQNSVFANAGFMPNDQFVSIGGTPITNQAAFYRYLGTVPVGQRVPIIVNRNGQQQTIYWTPDQRFVQMQPTFRTYVAAAAQPAAGANMLGISLDPNVTDAAVVASVAQGSPAANAGVRQGDQIIALNDQEVHSAAQFESAASQLPANSPARIAVARTVDLQLSPTQQAGTTVSGTTVVQPVAPGVADPARPVGPARRFRFR